MNRRGEKKGHVYGICESLLIFRIIGARWVERTSVIAGLNFLGKLQAVGITVVQQQFPLAEPARIQVGEISPRFTVRRRIGDLIRDLNSLHVDPHTGAKR